MNVSVSPGFFALGVVRLLMSPAEKGNAPGIPVPSVPLYNGTFSQQDSYLKQSRNVLPVCLKLLLTTWEKLKSREKNLGLSLFFSLCMGAEEVTDMKKHSLLRAGAKAFNCF